LSLKFRGPVLLGLNVKKNLQLLAGWRYLNVHYRNNSNLFLYDMAESGAVIEQVLFQVMRNGYFT
jgi:hypothetical protein